MSDPSTEPFFWGAATASYQIEGAAAEDGRAPSIWDVFAHTPGKIERGETGDVACDHYHRFKEDVALMADLGIQAYRFSVSWSRVLPQGVGRPNSAGFDFYDRLVDELMARGLTPFATLFHWDLPQVLQDSGGFANRDVVGWFSDYALQTAERLGDRVKHWIMLNEPSVYACLGHALGVHAPGLADLQTFLAVTHHLNLAQGAALQALRTANPAWRLGTTLNMHRGVPADGSEASAAMAERHNDLWNNCFLGPLLSSAYPTRILPEIGTICAFRRSGNDPPNDRLSRDQPLFPRLHPSGFQLLCWVFDPSRLRRRCPGPVSTGRSTHKSFETCCFGSTTLIPAHRFTLLKTAPTSTTPCRWTAKFTTLGASTSLTVTSKRCRKLKRRVSTFAAISFGRCWTISSGLAATARPSVSLRWILIACDASRRILISGTAILLGSTGTKRTPKRLQLRR